MNYQDPRELFENPPTPDKKRKEPKRPQLIEYGIQTENSHLRAHVGVETETLFVFQTRRAVDVMYKYQKHEVIVEDTVVATGFIVPPNAIPTLHKVPIDKELLAGFSRDLSTSEKGKLAEGVVRQMMKNGTFPWGALTGHPMAEECLELITSKEMQIEGSDILSKTRTQVKCDYDAGSKTKDGVKFGTGYLYLQTHELNPHKQH